MHSSALRRLLAGMFIAGLLAAGLYPMLRADAAPTPYLGIRFENTSHEPGQDGLVLGGVSPGGPADKAGLKKQDRIVSAGGRDMKSLADLRDLLASRKPGQALEIKVQRNGEERTVSVTLGEAPVSPVAPPPAAPPAAQRSAFLGVFTETLSAQQRQRLDVQAEHGVVVVNVLPNSPAAAAGLRHDDVITKVGPTPIAGPEELRAAVQKAGVGSEVAVQVARGKETLTVKAKLEAVPTGADQPGLIPGLPDDLRQLLQEHAGPLHDLSRVPALEKRVEQLEHRLHELEKKVAP